MPGCAAANCVNHFRKGFRLFVFPRQKERRMVWEVFCDREDWESTIHSRLCEEHFRYDQFENARQDGLRKLKPNAIPSLLSVSQKKILVQHKKEDYATMSSNIYKSEVGLNSLSQTNSSYSYELPQTEMVLIKQEELIVKEEDEL